MDRLLRLLLRVLVVPLGYLAGMLAMLVVMTMGLFDLSHALPRLMTLDLPGIVDAVIKVMTALSGLALTAWGLASVGMLFAEVFAVRSLLYHTLNVGLAGWIAGQMLTPFGSMPVDGADFYPLAAGLCGGVVYWIIAGWTSGFWKPIDGGRMPRRPKPAPAPVIPARFLTGPGGPGGPGGAGAPFPGQSRVVEAEILPPDSPVPMGLRSVPATPRQPGSS
ncbi:hypothetical protein [Ancylobacter lacus]|uniref:hypothetical protein n=1 Tax=Ancylobacter lacus TaxID=2579970 RepID=UPI001BCE9CC9|nr:hypothetical protein [Ancylobacter lacus]MBS7537640.1 hypothetical protein [Ancylobacter lacus]